MKISVEHLNQTPVSKQTIEIVERKGIGHPDSLADGICETASRVLSNYYKEKKGFILHHNLDKGLLVGGVSNVVFGGGKIIEPPDVIIAGTATILGSIDDIKMLIYEETEKYLHEHLRFTELLNPEIKVRIHPGSVDLVQLYNRFSKGEMPLANDTSFGVGFAPMTRLEGLVHSTENLLNSKRIKNKFPFIGEDIKVMGIRHNDTIDLTVAAAFVSKFVDGLEQYYDCKERLKELIEKEVDSDVHVSVNTADHEDSVYLTVSGTSWENGDDGQVGRGNRANGLITPCRPMSLEAVAGKNSQTHVGKIYNVLAQKIAGEISKLSCVAEVNVKLASQIGKPIDNPLIAAVGIIPEGGIKFKNLSHEAGNIVEGNLRDIRKISDEISKGKYQIF